MSQHIVIPDFPHWAKLTTTTAANPLAPTVTWVAPALIVVSTLLVLLAVASVIFLTFRRTRIRRHHEALNYEIQEELESGVLNFAERGSTRFVCLGGYGEAEPCLGAGSMDMPFRLFRQFKSLPPTHFLERFRDFDRFAGKDRIQWLVLVICNTSVGHRV
ncbi:hypothetical protein Y032_0170g234 [Ancylostoma ceylanicum]|uniref:Uncharacterized protein n=1 Tax=Ancylostoma ceylanicum TaxID=53326 RepID=A0A016SVT3_9BILA|nr:hypothetical protein Y032_0170g234 [Ancylostoma ceylanicum]